MLAVMTVKNNISNWVQTKIFTTVPTPALTLSAHTCNSCGQLHFSLFYKPSCSNRWDQMSPTAKIYNSVQPFDVIYLSRNAFVHWWRPSESAEIFWEYQNNSWEVHNMSSETIEEAGTSVHSRIKYTTRSLARKATFKLSFWQISIIQTLHYVLHYATSFWQGSSAIFHLNSQRNSADYMFYKPSYTCQVLPIPSFNWQLCNKTRRFSWGICQWGNLDKIYVVIHQKGPCRY